MNVLRFVLLLATIACIALAFPSGALAQQECKRTDSTHVTCAYAGPYELQFKSVDKVESIKVGSSAAVNYSRALWEAHVMSAPQNAGLRRKQSITRSDSVFIPAGVTLYVVRKTDAQKTSFGTRCYTESTPGMPCLEEIDRSTLRRW